MATIPYGLPQEDWPTISYFKRRFSRYFSDSTSDVSLYTFSEVEKFVQDYFVIFMGFLSFLCIFWPEALFCSFDWGFWCAHWMLLGLCISYFFLYLFVFGYPFGCHILNWFFLLFLNCGISPFGERLTAVLEMYFGIEINFCIETSYFSAVRTKTILCLLWICFWQIHVFVFWDFCCQSSTFHFQHFRDLGRLLSSILQNPEVKRKIRIHPKRNQFSRHVKLTRQMRFQLVRFLQTYNMHFDDLLEFLEENKQHFHELEQIYLSGVGTPMCT